jgi:hypothetical protein
MSYVPQKAYHEMLQATYQFYQGDKKVLYSTFAWTDVFKADIDSAALTFVRLDAAKKNIAEKINLRNNQSSTESYPPHIIAQMKGASISITVARGHELIKAEITELKAKTSELKEQSDNILKNLFELIYDSLELTPEYRKALLTSEHKLIMEYQKRVIVHKNTFLRNRAKTDKDKKAKDALKAKNKELSDTTMDQTVTTKDLNAAVKKAVSQTITNNAKGKGRATNSQSQKSSQPNPKSLKSTKIPIPNTRNGTSSSSHSSKQTRPASPMTGTKATKTVRTQDFRSSASK